MDKRRSGSVRAAINQFGDDPLKKPEMSSSRELQKARKDIDHYRDKRNAAESVKARAEFELVNAKKTVKTLSSLIEESTSMKAKTQVRDSKKTLRKLTNGESQEKYDHYREVMRELDFVKQELSKLKLDMALVKEEKMKVEKEKEESSSRLMVHSSSMEVLMKEIEETNEEQVLVELARIEALKEIQEIQAQREKEGKEFTSLIENNKKKVNELVEEIQSSKELEEKLAITLFDIGLLQDELKLAKETDARTEHEDAENLVMFWSVTEELESAKKEMELIKEESSQFMVSMDVVRNELKHVKEETRQMKKNEDKAELTIENLNSKLLRARAKLEAVSLAEEKANSLVTNLSFTLERLKTDTKLAAKEKERITEETENIKSDIWKTEAEIDVTEERVQNAIQELEGVKSSESIALKNLQSLIESTMRNRASPQHSSLITISKFEYEYLTGHAVQAEEVADKKVEAAKAWIEALKASEREILMKTEMVQKEMKEMKEGEEKDGYKSRRSVSGKRMEYWRKREEKNEEMENSELGLSPVKSRRSSIGNSTPLGRGKFRKPASPSTSFNMRRRRKAAPNLAKLFVGKSSIEDNNDQRVV